MTTEARKRVLRYAIAADLVILVTGIGLLFPRVNGDAIVGLYLVAVAVAGWKGGGWRGSIVAMLLSLLAAAAVFGTMDAWHAGVFAGASLVLALVARLLRSRRRPSAGPTADAATPLASVLTFERNGESDHRAGTEAERFPREVEGRTVAEREAARVAAEKKQVAEQRAAAEKKAAAEREAARITAEKLAEEQRVATEKRQAAEQRAAAEKKAAVEREAARVAAEKLAAEQKVAAEKKLAAEREAALREAERLARETEEKAARLAAEKKLAEEKRLADEKKLAAKIEAARREGEEKAARDSEAARNAARPEARTEVTPEKATPELQAKTGTAKTEAVPQSPQPGLIGRLSRWLRPAPKSPPPLNLQANKPSASAAAAPSMPLPKPAAPKTRERRPRILLLEKRRGTADVVLSKAREQGIEMEVVERWVDAVDELLRFQPDLFFLDCELPDFDKVYAAVRENTRNTPIILTAKQNALLPRVARAGTATRPYEIDVLAGLARDAMRDPMPFLERQAVPPPPSAPSPEARKEPAATAVVPPPSPIPPAPSPQVIAPKEEPKSASTKAEPTSPVAPRPPDVIAPAEELVAPAASPAALESDLAGYMAVCFNCREEFDTMEADWCGCLTKERSLVCTNCLTCFCKATPAYWETFWTSAPQRLLARREAERSSHHSPFVNPPAEEVVRPLVMLAEDDEKIQAVAQRICHNLGYGFVVAGNGEAGLALARLYRPNLILSDTFMPGLDGREMCRILKEENAGGGLRTVVMTGLYTDAKYRREALARFRLDEYLTKPVSITDLINLLQKHIQGVTGLPSQEDLYALHRKDVEAQQHPPLAKQPERAQAGMQRLLPLGLDAALPAAKPVRDRYEVLCFTCNRPFDATHAEWCNDEPGQTLVCSACGHCFCKAPAAWRERFWNDAPASLFERRLIGVSRSVVPHVNPPPAKSRRPLILLIGHDEEVELLIHTVVSSLGYGFVAAAEGKKGLALARQYHPDLMLTDAFLPNLDGCEVCRLLKDDPATKDVKSVLMTGRYTDQTFRDEAHSAFKVDDFLPRPLAVEDLLQLLKTYLPPVPRGRGREASA